MKTVVSLQNNPISLLDSTIPGVNELFTSPVRADGREKWVDFVTMFWHRDCIAMMSVSAFSERYRNWCAKNGYNFSADKVLELYAACREMVTTLPKNAVLSRINRAFLL